MNPLLNLKGRPKSRKNEKEEWQREGEKTNGKKSFFVGLLLMSPTANDITFISLDPLNNAMN